MITAEKPPLDDDLLVHYGVPGMKWGRHKVQEVSAGVRARKAALPHVQRSTVKKVAIGVGITAGVAASAYFLSKRGTTPRVKALESKSTKVGLKVAGKVLLRVGKMSAKVVTKTAVTTAKVGSTVGKVATVQTAKAVKKVSITSSQKTIEKGAKAGQAVAKGYTNFQAKRALRNAPQVVTTTSRIARLARRS